MSDPAVTLRKYHVPTRMIFGFCHPPTEEDAIDGDDEFVACRLCASELNDLHPFLADAADDEACAQLNVERKVIAEFIAENRGVVRDASTWLTARIDWTITGLVHRFFATFYPQIHQACERVNSLSDVELDGRSLRTWSETHFSDTASRPQYCSWLFIPDTVSDDTIGNLRIFYMATLQPHEMDVLIYLFTVLKPPELLIRELSKLSGKEAYINHYLSSGNKQSTSSSSHKKGHIKRQQLDPPIELAIAGYETGDPRDKRAERVAAMSPIILKRMQRLTTRLIFYTTDPRIVSLQPRPDYIFTPHRCYINVFEITLPSGASPDTWPSVQPRNSPKTAAAIGIDDQPW